MTISEAKQIQIIDFLKINGFLPVEIVNGKAWFMSPLRPNEKTASFIINLQKNTWHDYGGTGGHGDIINLITKLKNVSVTEALRLITEISFSSYKPFENKMIEANEDKGKITIDHVQEIKHPALKQYIAKRKVSLIFARKFLKEANYSLNGRKYFALAFVNDLGGYELRNDRFKGGNSPKYFTTIPGIDKSRINIFEGFMDFLSYCTHQKQVPEFNSIVLNSLVFLEKIDTILRDAEEINLFMDNDTSGRTAAEKIMKKYFYVNDLAPVIYPYHKDYNDFLMKRSTTNLS